MLLPIMLILFGIMFVFFGIQHFVRLNKTKKWKTVEADITQLSVKEVLVPGVRGMYKYYSPVASYEYKIDNASYKSDRVCVDTKGEIFEGVLEILCQFFNVEHNVMRRIDYDRQVRL